MDSPLFSMLLPFAFWLWEKVTFVFSRLRSATQSNLTSVPAQPDGALEQVVITSSPARLTIDSRQSRQEIEERQGFDPTTTLSGIHHTTGLSAARRVELLFLSQGQGGEARPGSSLVTTLESNSCTTVLSVVVSCGALDASGGMQTPRCSRYARDNAGARSFQFPMQEKIAA